VLSCFSVLFSEELSLLAFKVLEAAGCSGKVYLCTILHIHFHILDHNFNLVADIEGGTQAEGV